MNRWSMVCVLFLAFQSCTSFYSSAILGHDANGMPIPGRQGNAVTGSLGASLKVAPTASVFSDDSTQSVQSVLTLQASLPISSAARFVVQIGLGGYFSQNSIYLNRIDGVSDDTSNVLQQPLSYGYLLENRFLFVVGEEPASNGVFGLEAIYNKESGDYLSLRKDLANPTSNTVNTVYKTDSIDLSPSGTSLETSLLFGLHKYVAPRESWEAMGAVGVALPNWPNDQYHLFLQRIWFTYEANRLWWTLSVEGMNVLNVGVGLQVGFRLL